ncbi:MAG: hypothetical protein ACYTCU_05205 [Planctomycetota bacterium]|jgi:hypothetical protein
MLGTLTLGVLLGAIATTVVTRELADRRVHAMGYWAVVNQSGTSFADKSQHADTALSVVEALDAGRPDEARAHALQRTRELMIPIRRGPADMRLLIDSLDRRLARARNEDAAASN